MRKSDWRKQLHAGDKIKVILKLNIGNIDKIGIILNIVYLKNDQAYITFTDGSNLTVKLTEIH